MADPGIPLEGQITSNTLPEQDVLDVAENNQDGAAYNQWEMDKEVSNSSEEISGEYELVDGPPYKVVEEVQNGITIAAEQGKQQVINAGAEQYELSEFNHLFKQYREDNEAATAFYKKEMGIVDAYKGGEESYSLKEEPTSISLEKPAADTKAPESNESGVVEAYTGEQGSYDLKDEPTKDAKQNIFDDYPQSEPTQPKSNESGIVEKYSGTEGVFDIKKEEPKVESPKPVRHTIEIPKLDPIEPKISSESVTEIPTVEEIETPKVEIKKDKPASVKPTEVPPVSESTPKVVEEVERPVSAETLETPAIDFETFEGKRMEAEITAKLAPENRGIFGKLAHSGKRAFIDMAMYPFKNIVYKAESHVENTKTKIDALWRMSPWMKTGILYNSVMLSRQEQGWAFERGSLVKLKEQYDAAINKVKAFQEAYNEGKRQLDILAATPGMESVLARLTLSLDNIQKSINSSQGEALVLKNKYNSKYDQMKFHREKRDQLIAELQQKVERNLGPIEQRITSMEKYVGKLNTIIDKIDAQEKKFADFITNIKSRSTDPSYLEAIAGTVSVAEQSRAKAIEMINDKKRDQILEQRHLDDLKAQAEPWKAMRDKLNAQKETGNTFKRID